MDPRRHAGRPVLAGPWLALALFLALFAPAQGTQLKDISGLVGETIQLPCSVNAEKCGELHSIKWYRGSSRIFVFSERAKISRSEGEYTDRAELQYTGNSTASHLTVKQLEVGDEAVYKCEITYLEVREGCQVVQFINLTTLSGPRKKRPGQPGPPPHHGHSSRADQLIHSFIYMYFLYYFISAFF